jgi:hypothetical protein
MEINNEWVQIQRNQSRSFDYFLRLFECVRLKRERISNVNMLNSSIADSFVRSTNTDTAIAITIIVNKPSVLS